MRAPGQAQGWEQGLAPERAQTAFLGLVRVLSGAQGLGQVQL